MQLLCIQVFGLSLRDLRCPLTLNNYRIKNVLKKQQAYVIFYLIVLENGFAQTPTSKNYYAQNFAMYIALDIIFYLPLNWIPSMLLLYLPSMSKIVSGCIYIYTHIFLYMDREADIVTKKQQQIYIHSSEDSFFFPFHFIPLIWRPWL